MSSMFNKCDWDKALDEFIPVFTSDLSDLEEEPDPCVRRSNIRCAPARENGGRWSRRKPELNEIRSLRPVLFGPGGGTESDILERLEAGHEVYALNVRDWTVERLAQRNGVIEALESVSLDRDRQLFGLPRFALFICGCAAFHAGGYVYAADRALKAAYCRLQDIGCIAWFTLRIVVAEEGLQIPGRQGTDLLCVMRAHGRMSGSGMKAFDWERPRKGRVRKRRHRPRRSRRGASRTSPAEER